MPLNPPDVINAPAAVNPRLMLLYGPAKVGKTSALAQLPQSYLLDLKATEGSGADYLEYRGSRIDTLADLEMSYEQLRAWRKEGKFKRLIIDTVDSLEAWCEEACTDTYNKTADAKKNGVVASVYERAYGAGHHAVRTKFKEVVAELLRCADELVFVGHLRDKVLDKTQQEVIAKDIDLTGKLANIICYMVDATGYVFRDRQGKLKVTFATNELINCGVRCRHLIGKSFELGQMVDGKLVCNWEQIYLPTPATPAPQPAQEAKP